MCGTQAIYHIVLAPHSLPAELGSQFIAPADADAENL